MQRHHIFKFALIMIIFLNTYCHAAESLPVIRCAVVDIADKATSVQTQTGKAVADIYHLFSTWERAVKENNPEKIANLVTEDAEFWSNAVAPLIGRQALKDVFESFLNSYEFTQKYQCLELIIRHDYAFIRGIEHNTKVPRKGGETITSKQRTFSVIRQSKDGKWLFHRGMSNLPPG